MNESFSFVTNIFLMIESITLFC